MITRMLFRLRVPATPMDHVIVYETTNEKNAATLTANLQTIGSASGQVWIQRAEGDVLRMDDDRVDRLGVPTRGLIWTMRYYYESEPRGETDE